MDYIIAQVLDNYGYHYALHHQRDRISHLETQYYFTCRCIACTEDWPCYNLLPDADPIYLCVRYVSFKDVDREQETSFTLSF